MGTRRLLYALLLVVLQYTGVQIQAQDNCDVGCTDLLSFPPCTDGCIPGVVADDDQPTCKKKTCDDAGSFFFATGIDGSFKEIRCDKSSNKWKNELDDVITTGATCTKGYSCMTKTGKLKFDCDQSVYAIVGCSEVIFNDDQEKACPSPKTMHYRKSTETDWISARTSKLACDKTSGKWKIDDEEFSDANDQVICATSLTKKVFCNDMPSTCPPNANAAANCEQITTNPDATLKDCTSPGITYFYDFSAKMWAPEPAIECDTSNGQWLRGVTKTPLVNGDSFVCATEDPTPLKCTVTTPKTSNGVHLRGGCNGCVAVSFTDDAPLQCTSGNIYLNKENPGGVWIKAGPIVCDRTSGEWKEGLSKNYVVQQNDEVICSNKKPELYCEPLKSIDCINEKIVDPTADCEEIKANVDGTPSSCSKKIYRQTASNGIWSLNAVETGDIKCNTLTGTWEVETSNLSPGPSDSFICAVRDPRPEGSCQTPTAALVAATCPGGITYDCAPISNIDKRDTLDDSICGGNKLYFKTGSGMWELATSIKCDKKNSVWQHKKIGATTTDDLQSGDKVICASRNPSVSTCQTDAIKLTSDCTSLATEVQCEKMTFEADDLKCTDINKKIYITKTDPQYWEETTKIECNLATLQSPTPYWKQVDTGKQLVANHEVICAAKNPNAEPEVCAKFTPAISFDLCLTAVPPCVMPSDYTTEPKCAVKTNNLYYQKQGAEHYNKATSITCNDPLVQWKITFGPENVLMKEELSPNIPFENVVCAETNPKENNLCTPLVTDCGSGTDPTVTCNVPYDVKTVPSCRTGKLYFKADDKHKFMEAVFVWCNAGQWKAKYKFGDRKDLLETESGNLHVVCADSNPNAVACQLTKKPLKAESIYERDNDDSKKYEAGQEGICPQPLYETINEDGEVTKDIVCSPDGTWRDGENEDVGKIQCAIRKCKLCAPLIDDNYFYKYSSMGGVNSIDMTSDCARWKCVESPETLVVLATDGKEYYTNQVSCEDSKGWSFGVKDLEIDKIGCSQQWYCLNNWVDGTGETLEAKFPQVKLTCPPPDTPKLPTECVEAERIRSSANLPDTTLKCPDGKMMLIQMDLADYWEELATSTIHCDLTKGKWKVKINETGKDEDRDYKNRIVCATSNPYPKPTTTTTTTTPAPVLGICEFCNATNYNYTEAVSRPNASDECIMTAKPGYVLLVAQVEQKELTCARTDEFWKTADGRKVEAKDVSARLRAKEGTWKAGSYIIVGGVFLMIGGMAIGCVFVYMRMRKQPSVRENKKKERGVTKKYTASSVQKTGGRSSGGSRDSGKSKEGLTPSKMEENLEDAPTLKI